MALNNVPRENYPFSTAEGSAIPLDILKSEGLIYTTFDATAAIDINIPESSGVCFLYASEACFVQFKDEAVITPLLPSVPVNNVLTEGMVFVPAGHVIAVAISQGIARVLGLANSGYIVVQLVTRWNALDIDQNYTRR